jgi:hypothetical protein
MMQAALEVERMTVSAPTADRGRIVGGMVVDGS